MRKGETYIRFDSVKIDIKPASFKARFENLFNGQKELEDIANDAINQNIQVLASDALPQVGQGLEKAILRTVNQVFERAPEREIFPYA